MVEQKISLAVQNLNNIIVSNRTRNGVPINTRTFFYHIHGIISFTQTH